MARVCNLCGKGKKIGHNVSYSKRRTWRVFLPNLTWVKQANGKRIRVCMDCLGKLKKEGKIFKRVPRPAKVVEAVKTKEPEKVKKAELVVAPKKRVKQKQQTKE